MGTKKSLSKSQKIGELRTVYDTGKSTRARSLGTSRQGRTVERCKDLLARYYGDRLKGVILYGSLARGQAGPASDIDLLVLLSPPLDYFAELRCLVDVLYPIQLESEQLISAKPVSTNDFEKGSISLYRNARREGVVVR